jgi:hypothetical protein
MSKKHGAAFSMFRLKVCCEAYFAEEAPTTGRGAERRDDLLMGREVCCFLVRVERRDAERLTLLDKQQREQEAFLRITLTLC